MLTADQVDTLRKKLEQSETLHHRIMAKMTVSEFDLLAAWEQKERIDQEIGQLIRSAVQG